MIKPLVALGFRPPQYHGLLPSLLMNLHLVSSAAVATASAASPGAGGGQSELLLFGPILCRPNLHLVNVASPASAIAGPLGAGGVVYCGSEFL